MIYNRPVFDNNSKLLVDSMMCRQLGPMSTPAMIKPMIPGILNLRNSSGANKMISKVRARMSTGFLTGRYWLKNWLREEIVSGSELIVALSLVALVYKISPAGAFEHLVNGWNT